MEEDGEDHSEAPGGHRQEEFSYFSISSKPEAGVARGALPAAETQEGQVSLKEEALWNELEMLEVKSMMQSEKEAGEDLHERSAQRHVSIPDVDCTTQVPWCRDAEDALVCSSEPVVESEMVEGSKVRSGQLTPCLEEEVGPDATRQEEDLHVLLPPAGDHSPASQESLALSDTETFFDQICHFQSRRMNDQRCSFRKKRRGDDRPWQSAPATPTIERRTVFFPSTMSLQTEEFFDLVAWAQANRLNDQRADFLEPDLPVLVLAAPPPGKKMAAEQKAADEVRKKSEKEEEEKEKEKKKRFKQSRRFSTGSPGRPTQAPDEALYNMILIHQAERIEEQRSDPPIPAAAEDLFELLLRLQGARMEEQRTELPVALQQRKISLY
ncbi:G-protein-signaling modulator 3 [Lissotriton helveticus]